MVTTLITQRKTRAAKVPESTASTRNGHYSNPEQQAVTAYLRGEITRRDFLAQVGDERFKALWRQLAAAIQKLEKGVSKPSSRTTQAAVGGEKAVLQAMSVANSFLLWNLPHGFAAGPAPSGRLIVENTWLLPVVWTSPGFGIVGEVGKIAVDTGQKQVIGCTLLETIKKSGQQYDEQNEEKLETAFLQARKA